MSRLDDLKERGWKNLKQPEREEMKALERGGSEPAKQDDNFIPDEHKETIELKPQPEPSSRFGFEPKSDTVTVSRDEWDSVLRTINELKKGQKTEPLEKSDVEWRKVKEEDRTHTATLRVNDEGDYAVDLKLDKERSKWNDKTREFDVIYKITWQKENLEIYDTYILLADFIKFPTQQVFLVKKYVEKLEKLTGERKRQLFTDDQYKIKSGEMVDLKVTADRITFDIKLPSGKIWLAFPSNRLNL